MPESGISASSGSAHPDTQDCRAKEKRYAEYNKPHKCCVVDAHGSRIGATRPQSARKWLSKVAGRAVLGRLKACGTAGAGGADLRLDMQTPPPPPSPLTLASETRRHDRCSSSAKS